MKGKEGETKGSQQRKDRREETNQEETEIGCEGIRVGEENSKKGDRKRQLRISN